MLLLLLLFMAFLILKEKTNFQLWSSVLVAQCCLGPTHVCAAWSILLISRGTESKVLPLGFSGSRLSLKASDWRLLPSSFPTRPRRDSLPVGVLEGAEGGFLPKG